MATVCMDENNRVQQFSYDNAFDIWIENPEIFSEQPYYMLQDFIVREEQREPPIEGAEPYTINVCVLSPENLQEFNLRKNAKEIDEYQQVLDSTDYAMAQIAEQMMKASDVEELLSIAQSGFEKYKKKIAAREQAREEIAKLTKGEN